MIIWIKQGVTYDTGGADIKAGGIMAGMHRDKGGAAAVAGFMHAVNVLKPSNIKIIAGLAMVRNSVGSEAYLADEIIIARSGKRVRVGNTDAEDRMAMVDLLCHAKKRCIKVSFSITICKAIFPQENLPEPEIYTIATLTGHACIAFGTYSGIVANGPYRKAKLDFKLAEMGELIGDTDTLIPRKVLNVLYFQCSNLLARIKLLISHIIVRVLNVLNATQKLIMIASMRITCRRNEK